MIKKFFFSLFDDINILNTIKNKIQNFINTTFNEMTRELVKKVTVMYEWLIILLIMNLISSGVIIYLLMR